MKREKAKTTQSKKLSLAPLSFEEAITAILAVSPPQKEKKSTPKKKKAQE